MQHSERYLEADWPAPANVKAMVTTRNGGFSSGSYSSFNMGLYTGDDQTVVLKNRQQLITDWKLPTEPQWLKQVHGVDVIQARAGQEALEADAVFTNEEGVICTVLTADCLPVLFCDQSGTVVAAAHAGWKGLAAGVLENTVQAMNVDLSEIMVWFGPAISQNNFEIGPEVRDQFLALHPEAAMAFKPGDEDRWFADLCLLARQRLERMGVNRIFGGHFCSVDQSDLFYSYRRDGKVSGRMASLIWLNGYTSSTF